MKYTEYKYLYPPRPVQTTQPSEISKYDNGEYIVQPKYNGTCCVVFISPTGVTRVMNRHNGIITSNYSEINFSALNNTNGWMVLCGEFLNKNKLGEDGKPFNLKFIIWDILVYDSEYLLGSKLIDRLDLLERLFPSTSTIVTKDRINSYGHLCVTKFNGVFKAPTYMSDFEKLYEDIVNTDLYEGLVLKRKDAKLSLGLNEKNNNTWQIKCRKPTKNYDF